MKTGVLLLAGVLWVSGSPLLGQERNRQETGLPQEVGEEVINFFNHPSTIHFSGRTRIPSTRVVMGDVASLGGPFTLAGEVEGTLVVVNGDLVFEEGGTVTGDILVVGGRVLGREQGEVGGTLRIFHEPLRYLQRGDQISAADPPERREGVGPDFPWGDVRFIVKSGQNYNRTEGLPVMFGPSFRTAGVNPLRLDVFAVWRTDFGFELESEDFGYSIRVDQALGGRNDISIGGSFFSVVNPIEDWGITNLEASLATFILHEDYRDYYERDGWSAHLRLRIPDTPVEFRAEYFDEEHDFMPVINPWSITKNNETWRPQPLVAEGRIGYVEGTLTVDTRNDLGNPTDGWLAEARVRKGVRGDFSLPAHLTATEEDPPETIEAQPFDEDFFTGLLDIRRYLRINPGASLNLRGVMGGALTDISLPPQYQHAIGGVGSVPGHLLLSQDCGAREVDRVFDHPTDKGVLRTPVYPAYGCERFALFQAEFRTKIFSDWDFWDDQSDAWEDDPGWRPSIDFSPNLAAFFNAGKAWNVDDGDYSTVMDLGLGVFFGDLGLYFAYPLTEDNEGERDGNFFIRLSRRF